jgi:hypothetical protein
MVMLVMMRWILRATMCKPDREIKQARYGRALETDLFISNLFTDSLP